MEPAPELLDADDRRLLTALATGRSAAEVARAEGITLAALAVRLTAIRTRLGVSSTRGAIAAMSRCDHPGDTSTT